MRVTESSNFIQRQFDIHDCHACHTTHLLMWVSFQYGVYSYTCPSTGTLVSFFLKTITP